MCFFVATQYTCHLPSHSQTMVHLCLFSSFQAGFTPVQLWELPSPLLPLSPLESHFLAHLKDECKNTRSSSSRLLQRWFQASLHPLRCCQQNKTKQNKQNKTKGSIWGTVENMINYQVLSWIQSSGSMWKQERLRMSEAPWGYSGQGRKGSHIFWHSAQFSPIISWDFSAISSQTHPGVPSRVWPLTIEMLKCTVLKVKSMLVKLFFFLIEHWTFFPSLNIPSSGHANVSQEKIVIPALEFSAHFSWEDLMKVFLPQRGDWDMKTHWISKVKFFDCQYHASYII